MKEKRMKQSYNRPLPPKPHYVASHEEDAQTIVNNLVPKPTPRKKKDTDRTEDDKTTEDGRDLIEITDEDIEEDDLDSDLDLDYFY